MPIKPQPYTLRKSTSFANLPADIAKIKIPFPPNITAEGFLRNRPLSKTYFKPPNSFFIYRQQFVKLLKSENYSKQMVKVSKWASIFWSNEPNFVRQYYKDLEKDIQKLLKEQYQNDFQFVCSDFIFEYPNAECNNNTSRNIDPPPMMATTENSSPNVNNTFDWPSASESSNKNSPITPSYDNLEFSFDTRFPICSPNPFYTTVGNGNNLEPYFTLFDEMNDNNVSFLPDTTSQLCNQWDEHLYYNYDLNNFNGF